MDKRTRPAKPSVDPLSVTPPKCLAEREAIVELNLPNSIRVPCDLPPNDPKRWFDKALSDGNGRPLMPLDGNEVMYLIGYQEIHYAIGEAMQRAIDAKGRPNRFIYLSGLVLEPSASMKMPILDNLASASKAGVEVRAMLWKNNSQIAQAFLTQGIGAGIGTMGMAFLNLLTNQEAVKAINEHGMAIHDGRIPEFGSHHQKIFIIHDGLELVAFCGSMDMGSGAHEVQCRIRGPAAGSLLTVFLERWRDHPESAAIPGNEQCELVGLRISTSQIPHRGRQCVQIARTYGSRGISCGVSPARAGPKASFLPPRPYSFAPNGETSIKKMILHAISQARQFIYLEDQYLVSTEVSKALEIALARGLKHLTILVTLKSDMPQMGYRRVEFLAPLRKAGGERVGVFYRKDDAYVHSKLYIMDDQFAIVGSANCNRRSLEHDSEVMAAVCDQPDNEFYGYNFAHRLRIALWAEHLNMDTDEGRAQLADGVAGVAHWRTPSPQSRIAPYDEASFADDTGMDLTWNTIIDPGD